MTSGLDQWLLDDTDVSLLKEKSGVFSPIDLLISYVEQFVWGVNRFIQIMGSIRVFQINPSKSRELGVPTPRPELDRFGSNLPAVVDRMRKDWPNEWAAVMETMQAILPDLSSIEVSYVATSRQLALFFKEAGFGRPWNVAEVSDGTIQTLALLVAIFNPGPLALVLEEPENSVHPWIIRHIMEACRQASANKQIILTTHSPIVINRVPPEDVWVIWRENGESHLKELTQLDQKFRTLWEAGTVSTIEYVDSGALPQAVPPAPSDSQVLDEVS
jgi:predicted ATPase